MSTGKIIRELREDHDKTQQEIADLLKISRPYYSEYEREYREVPTRHLKILSLYYHVSADYILGLPEGLPYPKR